MRKLVCLLAGGAMVLVAAPPASADTAGCVTRGEFQHVKQGMTKEKVRQIFDTPGKRQELMTFRGFAAEVRSYRACSSQSIVAVAFDRNAHGKPFRVVKKYGVWL